MAQPMSLLRVLPPSPGNISHTRVEVRSLLRPPQGPQDPVGLLPVGTGMLASVLPLEGTHSHRLCTCLLPCTPSRNSIPFQEIHHTSEGLGMLNASLGSPPAPSPRQPSRNMGRGGKVQAEVGPGSRTL